MDDPLPVRSTFSGAMIPKFLLLNGEMLLICTGRAARALLGQSNSMMVVFLVPGWEQNSSIISAPKTPGASRRARSWFIFRRDDTAREWLPLYIYVCPVVTLAIVDSGHWGGILKPHRKKVLPDCRGCSSLQPGLVYSLVWMKIEQNATEGSNYILFLCGIPQLTATIHFYVGGTVLCEL